MSDQIRLVGIHGFGHHGVFEEEQRIGQDFYVDVVMEIDLSGAARSDLLKDTIDYGEVCELVVAQISAAPVALIERLAGQIGDLLFKKYPLLQKVSVTVHKPQAPVNIEFLDISVTIECVR
jgi:dihydroneopterin aldolase